jgi:citrate synthase
MSKKANTKSIGLRGIPVADTKISYIDGIKGKLIYRGYDIADLAGKASYEEVAYLLIYGNLPNQEQLQSFSRSINEARKLPERIINILKLVPKTTTTMDVIQSMVALIGGFDENSNESKDSNYSKAINLIGKIPTIITYWDRIKKELPLLEPDDTLTHAANFLYMLKGVKSENEISKIFETCIVLHAEHSFNASTFTARVVASTRATMYASISAAVGALSGELHGGANAQVMKNLFEIGNPANTEAWVKSKFDHNERIMGMGHAVYKTVDPRAVILKTLSNRLAQITGQSQWYEITNSIEEITKKEFNLRKGKEIFANVDLYSPSVYFNMGIDAELFTPIFAMARVAGWAANIIEEKYPEPPAKPMLYRPLAEYRGNYCGLIGCKFVPISQRIH